MHTLFCLENLNGKGNLGNLSTSKRTILTLRLLMTYIYIYIYIYGAHILDVSRSHTTTLHSR